MTTPEARLRHIEPHTCPREGPWSACDFNRYIATEAPGAAPSEPDDTFEIDEGVTEYESEWPATPQASA